MTHLSLLRSPLSIGIPVINNLITSSIPNFRSSVTKRSIGRPLDFVTSRLGNQEGLGASNFLVVIDTFSGGVVEDGA
jgi:hypothetical protein